ncbi:LOW QUALITY PROTEIN: hypothetical protein JCM24511_02327 [Saitozyma sp. JCM 24511]|nr:LOW QUALITY PROTEIN: hypothetical protein JCM24511_02327 [Saitozyma sp. JCM 24511]
MGAETEENGEDGEDGEVGNGGKDGVMSKARESRGEGLSDSGIRRGAELDGKFEMGRPGGGAG